jgi:hypothetical protein
MGGVGSGGHNRVSPQEHARRGTYRKSRHDRLAKVIPLASAEVTREVPAVPVELGDAGAENWILLWSKWPMLTDLDYQLVLDFCRACDDHQIARRRFAATTEAADARGLEATSRVKARLLVLLGVSPRDRVAMGVASTEGISRLDALRRAPKAKGEYDRGRREASSQRAPIWPGKP